MKDYKEKLVLIEIFPLKMLLFEMNYSIAPDYPDLHDYLLKKTEFLINVIFDTEDYDDSLNDFLDYIDQLNLFDYIDEIKSLITEHLQCSDNKLFKIKIANPKGLLSLVFLVPIGFKSNTKNVSIGVVFNEYIPRSLYWRQYLFYHLPVIDNRNYF